MGNKTSVSVQQFLKGVPMCLFVSRYKNHSLNFLLWSTFSGSHSFNYKSQNIHKKIFYFSFKKQSFLAYVYSLCIHLGPYSCKGLNKVILVILSHLLSCCPVAGWQEDRPAVPSYLLVQLPHLLSNQKSQCRIFYFLSSGRILNLLT